MIEELTPPDNPAAITARVAAEISRRFPPEVIADHIERLLGATIPPKPGKDGKPAGEPRLDPRGIESGLKMTALYFQMADNERRNGGGLPPARESDEAVIARLLASPAALKASLVIVARNQTGRRVMEEVLRECGPVIDMDMTMAA